MSSCDDEIRILALVAQINRIAGSLAALVRNSIPDVVDRLSWPAADYLFMRYFCASLTYATRRDNDDCKSRAGRTSPRIDAWKFSTCDWSTTFWIRCGVCICEFVRLGSTRRCPLGDAGWHYPWTAGRCRLSDTRQDALAFETDGNTLRHHVVGDILKAAEGRTPRVI